MEDCNSREVGQCLANALLQFIDPLINHEANWLENKQPPEFKTPK